MQQQIRFPLYFVCPTCWWPWPMAIKRGYLPLETVFRCLHLCLCIHKFADGKHPLPDHLEFLFLFYFCPGLVHQHPHECRPPPPSAINQFILVRHHHTFACWIIWLFFSANTSWSKLLLLSWYTQTRFLLLLYYFFLASVSVCSASYSLWTRVAVLSCVPCSRTNEL